VNTFFSFFTSSIGKKLVVGLSAFCLLGFLSFHLYANLHLYLGREAFNETAHLIHRQLIIPIFSVGLLGIIAFHAFLTMALWIQNRRAKGPGYRVERLSENRPVWTMALTGMLIACFIVLHVMRFKYNVGVEVHLAGGLRDMYGLTLAAFAQKPYAIFYIISTLLLGWHLLHGTQSFFRTFGLYTPRTAGAIKALGVVIALAFGLGFMSFPIWFGFVAPGGVCCQAHP